MPEDNEKFFDEKDNDEIKPIEYEGYTVIEEEPVDISEYDCLPFNKILNNCSAKDYTWELFPNEITANQLKQAGRTCYMVSALEAMSHVPYLWNYIFDEKFDNTSSEFSKKIKYKVNFTNKSYIVLNEFPMCYPIPHDDCENHNFNNYPQFPELRFMKPLEKEAYGIILEKVWAVIREGYDK